MRYTEDDGCAGLQQNDWYLDGGILEQHLIREVSRALDIVGRDLGLQ